MVKRAAEGAIADRKEAARYFVKEGEKIYFAFDRVRDPAVRQRASDVMRRVQQGKDADLSEIMWVIRTVFKQRGLFGVR